jgi:hypothetical protein
MCGAPLVRHGDGGVLGFFHRASMLFADCASLDDLVAEEITLS